jgi:catechol 2,3-dioxygenase-like lactoylglutathione lyase family enzyme
MTEKTIQQHSLDEAPIAPAQLHHIAFRTAGGEQMRAFYLSFLGVHPTLEVEGFAGFYTFDLAHHRLVLFSNPSSMEAASNKTGMHHVAFEHDSVDDLMRVYQRLKRKGILPQFAMNHGPTVSFYYQDPDRNVIELQIDNFGPDPRKSLEVMYALQSSPNPLGVILNPETYLAAWQAGATLAQLHQRPYAKERASARTRKMADDAGCT